MILRNDFQFCFDFSPSKPVVVEPSTAQGSGDGGLLPFRQLDERLGYTEQFSAALYDRRAVGYVDHTLPGDDTHADLWHSRRLRRPE